MSGVRLDPPSIVFPNTFVNMTSHFTLKVLNTSNKKKHFIFKSGDAEKNDDEMIKSRDIYNPKQRNESNSIIYYKNEVFSIEPIELDVWPNSMNQVSVTFAPTNPKKYTSICYIQVDDNQERIPLELMATGLPPSAYFPTSHISIGNVFLDSVMEYQVMLKNNGKVPVEFRYERRDTGKFQFEFSPEFGKIPADNEFPILVKFIAGSVGSFNEKFVFKIEGAIDNFPTLTFNGKVIGPSFEIHPRNIDFGSIGYGFLYSREFEIENKSEISFDYQLRLFNNKLFERREIQIRPECGTIDKFSKQKVIVDFIPTANRAYSIKLLLDIANYGQALAEIPITAQSICPKIQLVQDNYNFQNSYVGYKYSTEIFLANKSRYPAKFEYIPQDEFTRQIAIIDIDKLSGVAYPNSDSRILLEFTPKQLGVISIDCFFKILGSNDPPLKFTVLANSTGPTILFDQKAISFGSIPILIPKTIDITINNSSLIPAHFRSTIESSKGGFEVEPSNGTIDPDSNISLSITANLDDSLDFGGSLKLYFDFLNVITIPLKAKGVGYPILPSINMDEVDFGFILTQKQAFKSFTLENKSKRSYELKFTPSKVSTNSSMQNDFVFNIEPEQAVISSGSHQNFEMSIYCSKVLSFTMPLQCSVTKGRQKTTIFNSVIKGSFVKPLVEFSTKILKFLHKCIPNNDEMTDFKFDMGQNFKLTSREIEPKKDNLKTISNFLEITNKAKVGLPVQVDCPEPFFIDCDSFEIPPGQSKDLLVSFDTKFKDDFVSEIIQKALTFSFLGHPQKINVQLIGEIIFPNVKIESTDEIDFGVLMMNTESSKTLEISNIVDMPVQYEWELVSEDEVSNEVFDIYPLYGVIQPEEIIKTHFSFFAKENSDGKVHEYKINAVCHIIGGPDYVIPLRGSSATIMYKITPLNFNFTSICFSQQVKSSMYLTNTSKTAISFSIKIPKACHFQSFQIQPKTGVIAPQDTCEFKLCILPGTPSSFREAFYVVIGDFEEVQISVSLDAFFAQVLLSLPRNEDDPSVISLNEKKAKQYAEKSFQSTIKSIYSNGSIIKFSDTSSHISRSSISLELEEKDQSKLINNTNFTNDELLSEEKLIVVKQILSISKQAADMKAKNIKKINSSNKFAAHYNIYFKDLIISMQAHKTFTIKSESCFTFSFEMDLSKINGSGFKIEPSLIKDLAPGAEVEIEITFLPSNNKYQIAGDVSYDIPIVFSDGHQILLTICAELKLPVLGFSQHHFDFGEVIVGQCKVMTVQLQNMGSAPIEFSAGSARLCTDSNKLVSNRQLNIKGEKPFKMLPSSGILPPSSFLNVSIQFSPTSERCFNMQFPISITSNPNPSYITVTGFGKLLDLIFIPNELTLPIIQPYSSPSTAEVIVKNPSSYPIEVFSLQFDRQIIMEDTSDPRQNQGSDMPFVTYTPLARTPVAASKFAICIIINGPPFSGKSTLAGTLSAVLDIPVLDLHSIWDDTTDYLTKLYSTLRQPEYHKGVIIDGLEALKDKNHENEAFLTSLLKLSRSSKENLTSEINSNPFACWTNNSPCIIEKSLDILLSALNDHFVFHIAIMFPPEDSIARKAEKLKESNQDMTEEEINVLFNMSEEEYSLLNENDQKDVNEKRKHYREQLIQNIEKEIRISNESLKKTLKNPNQRSNKQKQKDMKQLQVPTNITHMQCLTFLYSLGNVTQKVQNETERFRVIDPVKMMNEKGMPVSAENFQYNKNTLLLDGTKPIEEIIDELFIYLPPMNALKEIAFMMQIPEDQIKDDLVSDYMQIVQEIPLNFSILTEEVLKPKLKSRRSSRPKSKSKPSISPKFLTGNAELDKHLEENLVNRWVLPPNGETTLRIKFESNQVGKVVDNLLFSITKCQMKPASLTVKGYCEYPEVERNLINIFQKNITKPDAKSCPAFVTGLNEFNFGNCLICKEKCSNSSQARYQTKVKLANVSPFNAECSISFIDETENKGLWFVEPSKITLTPSNTGVLNENLASNNITETKTTTSKKNVSNSNIDLLIGFHPTITGIYRAKLAIYIKDNPEPFYINFTGDASQPSFEISTGLIDFEKILVNHEKSQTFEIKNTGKLPIFWRMKGIHNFQPNITFSSSEGILQPLKSSTINALFTSTKAIQLKKNISIELFDSEKTRIFATSSLPISAESFDVNFDILFPKGSQDSFNFGMLKINQEKTITLSLRNRGKYPVSYKISLVETNIPFSKYLTVSNTEGEINSDKTTSISFTFKSSQPVKYDSIKCIQLLVVDCQTMHVTTNITYPISASTLYSLYSLDCEKSIHFGSISTECSYHQEFTISNTGSFPFEFVLSSIDEKYSQGVTPVNSTKRKTPKKINSNALLAYPFLLTPSSGNLAPGKSQIISVDLTYEENGKIQVPVNLTVSDAKPKEKTITINLQADCYAPGLFVDDFKKIFPNLPICMRSELLRVDKTSFIEDGNTLHFKATATNQKEKVDICLINDKPIDVDVSLFIKGKTKLIPFQLSDKSVHIKGNDKTIISIIFYPKNNENYQAMFEAIVRSPQDKANNKNNNKNSLRSLIFTVEGTGIIPSIVLKSQLDGKKEKFNQEKNGYTIKMGKTLIGYEKQKSIAIGNDCPIPANAIFQVRQRNSSQSSHDDLNNPNDSNDFEFTGVELNTPLPLNPGSLTSFTVKHKPQKTRKSQLDVIVKCAENEKNSILFSFIAEGYYEDIIFEGLGGDANELCFKGVVVGRLQTASFTMRNIGDSMIRFQWSTSTDIIFSPRMGHISSHQTKEISVTFVSDKPVKYIGAKCICQVRKIQLTENPNASNIDWDDSQKMITFVPRSELTVNDATTSQIPNKAVLSKEDHHTQAKSNKGKQSKGDKVKNSSKEINKTDFESTQGSDDLISVPAIRPEPNYRAINGTSMKEKIIKLFAIADFIKYSVDTQDIAFAPTMMYQIRYAEVNVTNVCQIRLEYEWTLEHLDSLRTNYTMTRPCPFAIEPSTGIIEPGESTLFRVSFSPLEVDDFTATYKFNVPYYVGQSHTLSISAISKRPVCHFNVVTSDYLTRRHPDYVDFPLPEDIKVIEILAKEIKTKVFKKIEIINPTSFPYESFWTKVRDNSNGAIQCEIDNAIISSGRRYFFNFSYFPKNTKTVESLYLFEIPEHKVQANFLIVGRIVR